MSQSLVAAFRLQYGVLTLTLTLAGIMVLAWKGKLDATVATLLATLLKVKAAPSRAN